MNEHEKQIPIWFFIGGMLLIYGLLITGNGIYSWNTPPPPKMPEQIHALHAPVWWGAMMVVLGLFYVVKFWPSKDESLTGKLDDHQAAPPPAAKH